MINYTIDPAIFNPPNIQFVDSSGDVNEKLLCEYNTKVINFYEKIEKIKELIDSEGAAVFLFNFTKISFAIGYLEKAGISELPVDQIKTILDQLQSYYYPDPFTDNRKNPKGKYFLFEDWFKMEDLKYKSACIAPVLQGKKQRYFKNKDEIVKISILNNFVYKNSGLHFLLANDSMEFIVECKRIRLLLDKSLRKQESMTEKVQMKNMFDIAEKSQRQFESVFDAYKTAKVRFSKYIIFGKDVERGINTIEGDAGPPDRIFAYLETLKEFCEYKRNGNIDFHDDYMVQAFGCICTPEKPEHIQDERARNDRMYDNGKNKKVFFELHLKPCTFSRYEDYDKKSKTVRIYFLWDDRLKKVIVGWIGRHPYVPDDQ